VVYCQPFLIIKKKCLLKKKLLYKLKNGTGVFMKKFFVLCAFLCSAIGISATDIEVAAMTSSDTSSKVPYDADLFRKDVKVGFIDLEFLYWTAEVADLDYALVMNTPARDTSNNLYAQGDYQHAKYNWDPGFRITLGYFNAPHYWQVYGTYTWQYITGRTHVEKPSQDDLYLVSTWPDDIAASSENPLLAADSCVRLNYSVADLIFDRVYITNPHLRLKLLGGLVGAYIKQRFYIDYSTAENASHIYNMWRFGGIGFRLGVGLDWFLGADFYLTAKATTAVLLGSYKNQSYQVANRLSDHEGDDITIPVRNATYTDWRPSFETQFLVGPSYQKSFKSWRFELFAGYEITSWFNINEIYRSSGYTGLYPGVYQQTFINNSAIALHGLTVRTTFDF
jgi:hypothetical protein